MDGAFRLGHRFSLMVDEAFAQRLDAWRRSHPSLPTRSAAVRILVDQGLSSWRWSDALDAGAMAEMPSPAPSPALTTAEMDERA